ncbi:AMP-binding enzyme [Phytophthora infestans]|uniref:AMP-binding enzyme n=1 Tax=Phytophthora infestans TaxID=4787 RepID=A0A8S9TXG0_PHYIN|nr:AMP-binding enzyme [Phytophthora infestans]
MTLSQLMEIGCAILVEADPPLPDDLCSICYTSGMTGDPKPWDPRRNVQAHIIAKEGCIGYYQGEVPKLLDDMAELRPTVFPSVPRLLNRVHDKITQGVVAAGGLKKLLFDQAYPAKKEYLAEGYYTHLPCAGKGYGLPGTAAVVSCAMAEMPMTRHVRVPVVGAEICLEDVPEKHYSTRDTPCPRGEILTRSGHVFKGYDKQPELTSEWSPDGTLTDIDRKKHIYKLAQGDDSFENYVVGIVVPDPEYASAWAEMQRLEGEETSLYKLCDPVNKSPLRVIQEDLRQLALAAKLLPFERAHKLRLHAEQLTLENGVATPTFKPKRFELIKYFSDVIDEMYEEQSKL